MTPKNLVRAVLPLFAVRAIRLWRLRRVVSGFTPRVVRRQIGDNAFDLHLADPLGQGWYDRDGAEPAEVAFLRHRVLRPGARVFDLGAHQCVVALSLSRIVGADGAVIAVEANAHNATVAVENKRLNHADNLRVVHAAVAARAGTLIFDELLNGNVDDGTGGWGRTKVPAVTIDGLSDEYGLPDVLFVDVEGYEIEALEGAEVTLRSKPNCFVEVHVNHGLEKFGGTPDRVAAFFDPDCYELLMATPTQQKPIPLDLESAVVRDRFYLYALARSRTALRDLGSAH